MKEITPEFEQLLRKRYVSILQMAKRVSNIRMADLAVIVAASKLRTDVVPEHIEMLADILIKDSRAAK